MRQIKIPPTDNITLHSLTTTFQQFRTQQAQITFPMAYSLSPTESVIVFHSVVFFPGFREALLSTDSPQMSAFFHNGDCLQFASNTFTEIIPTEMLFLKLSLKVSENKKECKKYESLQDFE